MMGIRRITAIAALVALLVTATGGAAFAAKGGAQGQSTKLSEKFRDMEQYNWGLGDVVRLMAMGIFKGRSETEFAPGAAITRQEMAVAAVRLMGREADAAALSADEVSLLLHGMADAEGIAAWARPAVALLVDLEAIDPAAPFHPTAEATRLDVAVLLTKVLGWGAEAEAEMTATLGFKDAAEIPAELVGYVAVAVDHGLIKGYENGSFLPGRAVKRVEMAVMMGRADRQLAERPSAHNRRELLQRGIVTAVDPAHAKLTLKAGEKSLELTLATEAAIFVNRAEASLAEIAAGMKAEVKLNAEGLAIFVEARSVEQEEQEQQKAEVTGAITGLTAADGESLAVVEIAGEAYTLAPEAVIRLKGKSGAFADLKVGDAVTALVSAGAIVRLNVDRDLPEGSENKDDESAAGDAKTVQGTIDLLVSLGSGQTRIVVSTQAKGKAHFDRFVIGAETAIMLNGAAAAIADLKAGDAVTLTILDEQVQKVEATR